MIGMTNELQDQADCLHLHILNCSCTCGHKWTHSNLWLASQKAGYLGGTPDPHQSLKLPCLSMEETQRHYEHCARCVPLALGKSWVSPLKLQLVTPGRVLASSAASTEDLLA